MSGNSFARPLRVLIIESDEHLLEFFAAVLVAKGYDVKITTAETVTLALVSEFRPDAVFISVPPSTESAYSLCADFRRLSEVSIGLVVAISRYGHPKSFREKESGFDYQFTKPVALETMLETLQSLDGYTGNTVPFVKFPFYSDARKLV